MQVLFAIVLLMTFVHAATVDDIFLVSRDTNEKVKTLDDKISAMEVKVETAARDAEQAQYATTNLNGNIMFSVLAIVVFGVFLGGYVSFYFIAKTFREEIHNFAELKFRNEAPEQVAVVEKKPEMQYDIVKKKICPKGGEEGNDFDVFCPLHGKKYIIKEVKVPKEIAPNLGAIQAGGDKLERRARRKILGIF